MCPSGRFLLNENQTDVYTNRWSIPCSRAQEQVGRITDYYVALLLAYCSMITCDRGVLPNVQTRCICQVGNPKYRCKDIALCIVQLLCYLWQFRVYIKCPIKKSLTSAHKLLTWPADFVSLFCFSQGLLALAIKPNIPVVSVKCQIAAHVVYNYSISEQVNATGHMESRIRPASDTAIRF